MSAFNRYTTHSENCTEDYKLLYVFMSRKPNKHNTNEKFLVLNKFNRFVCMRINVFRTSVGSQRPYNVESTGSHPNTEVKQRRAWLVLGWVTAWEHQVLLTFKIEEVDHYIYLGQRISMETASKEQEIKRRITLGWQAFGRASAIFKNKEIPTYLKRQVYNQCIIPTVTYGSETWNLTKIQTMKLRSMQRAHERIMLNITWRDHKTAEWIREQTKLRDILETISKAKWTWAGHLTRRTDNRWTTKLTFWQPRGHTRNKGRPKFRWRDDLDKFRKHWHRDASDRLRWRQMGKAYVQLRTFKG